MVRYGLYFIFPSVCVCVTSYMYLRISNFWKSRNVKATIPIPFFGKFLEVLRYGTLQTCNIIYNSFEKERYVGVFYTTKPVVFLRDPALIVDVLKDAEHFQNRGNKIGKNDFMSQSILFVDNQRWETLHSKLEVVFKKEETCRYFYLVNLSVENFIKQLKDNNVNMINIHEHLTKLYQNISMILCVGDFTKILDQKVDINKRFNCLYSSKFEKNVFIGPVYPCWFSTLRSNILSKTGEYFRKIVRDVVEFRDNNGYAREDLLQSFLNARGGMKAHAKLDEDFVFDNDAVVAQSLTMLLLGKDMLSNTTAFCLYELSKQPDIQKRVTNELKTVMKKYDGFSPKSLLELGYLRQVVTETLRKYPSIPVFTRACTKKYSQNDGQLCLEPGDVVAIPIYAIQNDNQHFPLADVFMPERFSDEEKHKVKSGTFLPFGHGSRRCIAQDLSLMQIFLVLTSILSHFELFPCKEEVALSNSSFLTSPKNGMTFIITFGGLSVESNQIVRSLMHLFLWCGTLQVIFGSAVDS